VFHASLNRVGDIRRADLDEQFSRANRVDVPRTSPPASPSLSGSPLRARAILDTEEAPGRALWLLPLKSSNRATLDPVPEIAARVTVGVDDFGLLPDLDEALQRGVAELSGK
jgi:hypothetical protein